MIGLGFGLRLARALLISGHDGEDRRCAMNDTFPPMERDGSTPELAIIEDQWVWRRRNCPDATLLLQRLIRRNGKDFDELRLMSAGEVRVVYFDVSHLFEKFGRP
jgi:hypothetical protein